MKKGKLIAVIIAVVLIVIGCTISFCSLAYVDFDMKHFNNFKYVSSTYDITEPFEDISIDTGSIDVNFVPSKDNRCKVECKETDKQSHYIHVENNTLMIEEENTGDWFDNIHIGFYWENTHIDVHLPENIYNNLYISGRSGNIYIPDNFSFNKADITISSGEVNFAGDVKNDLSVSATSGDIKLINVKAQNIESSITSGDIECYDLLCYNRMNMSATSGDISLERCNSDYFYSKVTSGDTELDECNIGLDMSIEAKSGDIDIYRCDAQTLDLESKNGDITGVLLTDKIFYAESQNGDVDIPRTMSGGRCEAHTKNGDIEFTVLN